MSNEEQGNALGRRIRAARERKGWTQGQLAERIGVKTRSVGNWENGHTTPMNRLAMLEDVLGPGVVEPSDVKVSRTAGRGEVEVMLAHFDDLSQMDLLRLSRLIQDIALGEG